MSYDTIFVLCTSLLLKFFLSLKWSMVYVDMESLVYFFFFFHFQQIKTKKKKEEKNKNLKNIYTYVYIYRERERELKEIHFFKLACYKL